MFASICRRRLLRLRQIPSAAGTNPSWPPNPIDLHFHGNSTSAIAGAAVSEPCPATVSYLISCGLSPAAAAASKRRIRSTDRADAVRALFRSYGFTDADITGMIRQASLILTLDPDRILRPKLDLYASLGIQPRKLASTTALFMRSLDKHLIPCIQFLRGILGTDDAVCRAISGNPRGLTMGDLDRNMRPAVDTLRRLGLPEKSISKLLILNVGVFMISPDRMSEIFEHLKSLGLGVTDSVFVYGIRALSGLSRETWLRRVSLYKSFGLSEGEFVEAFKKQPWIMRLSDEMVTKKMRFYLDELKLELSDLMGQPVLLGYSMEKRIIPRCAVLSVLMREGKIQPNIKLLSALLANARNFSKKYVLRYAHEVPDVVKAYEGKIAFEGFRGRDVLVPLNP
ncbi:unnamed protein product [Urochloa decumbens]|uniref:Uncharacterized protein n=1 Tax=Urochloa decumbens TaxID=240449 RepID=A0ABC8WEI6_9POAL